MEVARQASQLYLFHEKCASNYLVSTYFNSSMESEKRIQNDRMRNEDC